MYVHYYLSLCSRHAYFNDLVIKLKSPTKVQPESSAQTRTRSYAQTTARSREQTSARSSTQTIVRNIIPYLRESV